MSPPATKVNDLSWMIGGPQGSGVDSSANVFARACAHAGLNVFGKREYYSNIMGERSYFALRDPRAILYDPSLGKTRISDVPTLEKRLAADLKPYLISRGLGETLDDLLAACRQRGVTLVPIPYKALLEKIAEAFQVDQLSKIARMVNMLAVGGAVGGLGLGPGPGGSAAPAA